MLGSHRQDGMATEGAGGTEPENERGEQSTTQPSPDSEEKERSEQAAGAGRAPSLCWGGGAGAEQ